MSHGKTVECEMTNPNLIHQAVAKVLESYPGINIQIAPDPTQNSLKLREYHGERPAAIIISQDRNQKGPQLGAHYGDIGFIYDPATGKYSMRLDDMDENRINRSIGTALNLGANEQTQLIDEIQSVYAAMEEFQQVASMVNVNQGIEGIAPMNDAQDGAGWGMVVEVDEDDLRRLGVQIPR